MQVPLEINLLYRLSYFTFRVNEYKPFTLTYFLRRQAHILHGEEERDLRYVPKVCFVYVFTILTLIYILFSPFFYVDLSSHVLILFPVLMETLQGHGQTSV